MAAELPPLPPLPPLPRALRLWERDGVLVTTFGWPAGALAPGELRLPVCAPGSVLARGAPDAIVDLGPRAVRRFWRETDRDDVRRGTVHYTEVR